MVETMLAAGGAGVKEATEGQGGNLGAQTASFKSGSLRSTGGGGGVDEIEARLFAD